MVIVIGIIIVLAVACVKFFMDSKGYEKLCEQLSAQVKAMYCKEPGCTNLKYYSTPEDEIKGLITPYCSVHLVKHTGNPDG